MDFFDINTIAVEVLRYKVSYIELLGTIFGLLSVFYATRTSILTWPMGIINELFFTLLFFQVQLYADMFLQIYYFILTIYGWYSWRKESMKHKVTIISFANRIKLIIIICIGTIISGYLLTHIHLYLPKFFKEPASFPYLDSLIMISSIVATILLAKKKIETWYMWIIIDSICVLLYCSKEIYFLSLEYFMFLILAVSGISQWKKELKT